jgi:hypothetical protein
VRIAAKEKLRKELRTGRLTRAHLVNSVEDGGLKHADVAERLGVRSRATAKEVLRSVLSETEFAVKMPGKNSDKP